MVVCSLFHWTMDAWRSSRIASRHGRRRGSRMVTSYAGFTARRCGLPKVVRVEEEILAPHAVTPKLVWDDESYHLYSDHQVSNGSIENFVVPSRSEGGPEVVASTGTHA